MIVKADELPADWQGINLCRISTSLMDELKVSPGDLVLVSSVDRKKESFTRVGVRCVNYHAREIPLQLDPDLLAFLGLHPGDKVDVTHGQPNHLESLSLEAIKVREHADREEDVFDSVDLTEDEKDVYVQIIKNSGWPIFQGGMFGINVSGEPVFFHVESSANPHADKSIVTSQTLIDIFGAEEKQILQIKSRIRQSKIALLDLEKDIVHRQKVLESRKSELEQIIARTEVIVSQENALTNKRNLLEDELASISEKAIEKEKELEKLVSHIAELHRERNDLEEASENSDFDIEGKTEVRNTLLNKLTRLIADLNKNE
jgi:hypothetical protein